MAASVIAARRRTSPTSGSNADAAIASGSLCYWASVSRLISGFRQHLDERRMALINRYAGIVLIGFGAVLVGELMLERLRA